MYIREASATSWIINTKVSTLIFLSSKRLALAGFSKIKGKPAEMDYLEG